MKFSKHARLRGVCRKAWRCKSSPAQMNLSNRKCVPCEVGGNPLKPEEVAIFMADFPMWRAIDNKKIEKEWKFKNFKEAVDFVNKVAEIAENEGHHPDIYIYYNKVNLELSTHAVGGLSENDFILAAKIDKLF